MKKIRLITASFGTDRKELEVKAPLVYKDYIIDQVFYNNSNTPSRVNSLHPRTKGKIPKMMEWYEYPEYDYYIWIDSKFTILDGFLENMLEFENDDAELFFFNHPERSSVKDELDFMLEMMKNGSPYLLRRYEGENMIGQVNKYLSDQSFIDNKLFYCGLFMYKKQLVKNKDFNFMIEWFLHCALYSIQDQLSFPYLLHKHQVKYKLYPKPLLRSEFINYV